MSPKSSTTVSASLVQAVRAAEFLKYGSEAVRASVLLALRDGEQGGAELSEATGRPSDLLASHITQLRVGGLIESSRGQRQSTYRLTDRGRKLAGAIDSLTAGEASR